MAGNSIYDKGQTAFQADRILSAIDPASVRLDGRSFYDLVEQSFRFAKTINFFNTDDEIDGTWENLFSDITMMTPDGPAIDRDKIDRMMCSGETPPPLALLLTFIRLFSIEQDNLNLLTRKHLEFYYHDVLHMSKRKGTAGNVPVRLVLDKGYDNVFIPKGTTFLAGKDADGKDIRYRTSRDYTLTKAKVVDKKAFRKDPLTYELENLDDIQLPDRGFGFAIASPMFEFGHGTAKLQFHETNATLHSMFRNIVNIHYTSDKGWATTTAQVLDDAYGSSSSSLNSMVGSNLLIDEFISEVKITIEESSPIVKYDSAIHGGSYHENSPVIIFDFGRSTDTLKGCESATGFKLMGINMSGYDGFKMEGENGPVQNKVGAMPFGNEPLKDARFYLKSPLFRYACGQIFSGHLDVGCRSQMQEDTYTFWLDANIDYKGYANKVIEAIRNETAIPAKPESPKIQEPYIFERLSLMCDDSQNRYYSVTPYGEAVGGGSDALMDFRDLLIDDTDGGYYLGLSDTSEGTAMSCYFHITPKTVSREAELKLTAMFNQRFKENIEILTDSTKGLTRSGVMSFRIPRSSGTIMPMDRVWACISRCQGKISQIDSQVIEVEPDPESPGRIPVGTALPAGSISKVENKIRGLKGVCQDVDGCKGIYDETDVQFYARVSELLRHKNRAYSAWDYERLILEKFPQVAGVNCRRARNNDQPGTIWINVIPGMEARKSLDALDETFPDSTREDIKEFLKEHTSPFATIHVNNPRYQKVPISAEISLKKEFAGNDLYYKDKINKAIIEFLTPWKDDDHFNTLSTNRFNISKITYMLERLEYVDHVHGISARHNKEIKDGYVYADESDNLLTILIPDSNNTITIK